MDGISCWKLFVAAAAAIRKSVMWHLAEFVVTDKLVVTRLLKKR